MEARFAVSLTCLTRLLGIAVRTVVPALVDAAGTQAIRELRSLKERGCGAANTV